MVAPNLCASSGQSLELFKLIEPKLYLSGRGQVRDVRQQDSKSQQEQRVPEAYVTKVFEKAALLLCELNSKNRKYSFRGILPRPLYFLSEHDPPQIISRMSTSLSSLRACIE
jgi:hypothetical protein